MVLLFRYHIFMPANVTLSWRTIALAAIIPVILIGVLVTMLIRTTLPFGDEFETVAPSSSSSSSASGLSSSSLTSSEASSSPLAAIAPFDGCQGTLKYYDQAWFAEARKAAEKEDVYLDDFSSVPEACLSKDYLIAIYRVAFDKNMIVRYDRATKTIAKATLEGEHPAPVANTFAKRNGDLVPLLLDGCSSGTYDVRRNVIVGNGERCETRYCSMKPIPTAIGRDMLPVAPKYAKLGMLGELFTAGDCPDPRTSQLYGMTQSFSWGARLRLKATPSTGLENELYNSGFQCTNNGCTEWENSATSIPAGELLRLRSYIHEITGYECIHCG